MWTFFSSELNSHQNDYSENVVSLIKLLIILLKSKKKIVRLFCGVTSSKQG